MTIPVKERPNWPVLQQWDEYLLVLEFLESQPVNDVLEIGVAHGGTLMGWASIWPTARIMGVDIDLGQLAQDYFLWFVDANPDAKLLLAEGPSDDELVVRKVQDNFPTGIDFLFIDGDHTYEAAERDFNNYAPLVRPGGWIALHDASGPHACARFWENIRGNYPQRIEIALADEHYCGFGLVKV